jgi:hypothetical protein
MAISLHLTEALTAMAT